MAINKQDIVEIDLNREGLHRGRLNRIIGENDALGNAFGVRLFRDGQAESLNGATVKGYFRTSAGTTITISSGNSISGNEAVVNLPASCYEYEGDFILAIKITQGGVTSTVRIIDGTVLNTFSPVS